jgi:hypothetical protein
MSIADGRPIDSRTSHLMKGVPAMDIYSILSPKPHNLHYLNRYITFIEQCQQKNIGYEGYVERHHICPKADDMFPEYEDFLLHPWNCATLTPRQHFIAHIMLWKTFPSSHSQTYAAWGMKILNGEKINGRIFENLKNDFIERISIANKNKVTVRDDNGNYFYVHKDDPLYTSGKLVSATKGKVTAKNKNGEISVVNVNDPRYTSGELVHIFKGTVPVKDQDGKVFRVSLDDQRYISGELVHNLKGTVTAKDKYGNTTRVCLDDPRYKSGELVHNLKGTVPVKDAYGNTTRVYLDDPRYISGELSVFTKDVNKGKVVVKDTDGNTLSVQIDDPRYLSGELVGINKGKVVVKDLKGNTFRVSRDDPRYLSGELVGIRKGIPRKKVKIL